MIALVANDILTTMLQVIGVVPPSSPTPPQRANPYKQHRLDFPRRRCADIVGALYDLYIWSWDKVARWRRNQHRVDSRLVSRRLNDFPAALWKLRLKSG